MGEGKLTAIVPPDGLVSPCPAASGRIAHVSDRHVARERLQLLLVEDLRDQAQLAHRRDVSALAGRDPGGLLPAMLERVEPEVGEPRDVAAGCVCRTPRTRRAGHRDRERQSAGRSLLWEVSTSGDRMAGQELQPAQAALAAGTARLDPLRCPNAGLLTLRAGAAGGVAGGNRPPPGALPEAASRGRPCLHRSRPPPGRARSARGGIGATAAPSAAIAIDTRIPGWNPSRSASALPATALDPEVPASITA